MRIVFVLFLLLNGAVLVDAIFSWLFGVKSAATKDLPRTDDAVGSRSRRDMALATLKEVEKSLVNFDMGTDVKYVSDSTRSELEKLSAVDNCHHQLVIKLSKSCGRLNEEDQGKLAVRLLNCQLENEGRQTYACTDEMTLRECTVTMSPTVWNAYQIVGNRARAVCHATKQDQFRIKAEMAVNQLMHSTVGQLRAMEKLQEGQTKLGQAAGETIRKMYEGQEDLMFRQEVLKSSHHEVQEFVADNLKALTKEKALIAAGNQELARITESIKAKLDQATAQLEEQRKDRQENHADIVSDLALIQSKAKDVWDKIDANTRHLMAYQDQTTEQYQATIANLQQLNDTVSYILASVRDLKQGIDARFGWVTTIVKASHENIAVVYIVALHSGYFILAAILASFLKTELFTRTVILVIVPLNCVAAVRHGVALDFLALSLFVLCIVAVTWIFNVVNSFCAPTQCGSTAPSTKGSPLKFCHPTPLVKSEKDRNSGLSRRDLAKIATALRDVLSERRRHSSSTPIDVSCDSALDSSFTEPSPFLEPLTPVGCHTPMPEQTATFNHDIHDQVVTQTLTQVRSRLLNSLVVPAPQRSRSLPQTPARTPTKQSSFMSVGVLSPGRSQCTSLTKAGKRCKGRCLHGQDVCRIHNDDVSDASYLTNDATILNR